VARSDSGATTNTVTCVPEGSSDPITGFLNAEKSWAEDTRHPALTLSV
jgi:hypothetical protein